MTELPKNFENLLDDETTSPNDSQLKNLDPEPQGEGEVVDPVPQDGEKDTSTTDGEPSPDQDLISEFLKDRGIEDSSKLKYEDENGDIIEVDFNSLSREEQLNILKEISTPDLSEHERDVVNYLRRNGATLEEVIDYFKTQAVEEYKQQAETQPTQTYNVDSYNDDELYVADLKARYENMSEEELKYELDKAKENEELFKKKVDIIRADYKAKEEQIALDAQREEEEQYNQLRSSLTDAVSKFNEISLDYKDPKSDTLLVEDEEKEEILSYLLDQDANGYSRFFKDLNNPEVLVKLAWYQLHGNDAISNISSYWKDILKKERREAKEPQQKNVAKVTVVPDNSKDKKPNSLSDLYDRFYK